MLSDNPFSMTHARVALQRFALGKAISLGVGLVLLLLLPRTLPKQDYGAYLALLALLEVIHLVSSAGAYPVVQRYATELHARANRPALKRLIQFAVSYRLLTLLISSVGIFVLASFLAPLMGMDGAADLLSLYCAVIFCEGIARYLDLVFECLLRQGTAQFSVLLRNGLRLVLIFVVLAWSGGLSVGKLVVIEIVSSLVGTLFVTQRLYAFLRSQGSTVTDGSQGLDVTRIATFSWKIFVAQVLSHAYSPDAIKLLLAKIVGVAEVAVFGLAHALSAVMLRFLPIQLLLGWLRPLLVARHVREGSMERQVQLVGLAMKLNFLLLAPAIAFVATNSTEVVRLVGGGGYQSSAGILTALVGLLAVQSLHVVLSLLATTAEHHQGVMRAAYMAMPGLLCGLALAGTLGSLGMVVGLWISEMAFCATLWIDLRRRGVAFVMDVVGMLKVFGAAFFSANVVFLIHGSQPSALELVANAAVTFFLFLAISSVLRPLSSTEVLDLKRFLSRKMIENVS